MKNLDYLSKEYKAACVKAAKVFGVSAEFCQQAQYSTVYINFADGSGVELHDEVTDLAVAFDISKTLVYAVLLYIEVTANKKYYAKHEENVALHEEFRGISVPVEEKDSIKIEDVYVELD